MTETFALRDFKILRLLMNFPKSATVLRYVIPLVFSVALFSCGDNQKEKMLEQREAALKERERAFGKKEADYQLLLQWRDSVMQQRTDTTVVHRWPQELLGQWNSRIVCKASNCSDYVIGDTRNDIWEFTQDSTRLYVNVRDRKRLVRVYRARYENQQIQLFYATDSTAKKQVEMHVVLDEISANRLRGKRTVSLDGNCSATFEVTLTKSVTQQ